MPSVERRERERLELREKILDAARALFVAEGFDAVSMRKIASAIEYSPAAIYLHFPDKESLFRELCRCDYGKLGEATHALASIVDPVERIEALGRAYIEFAVKHPNHYRLMFMTPHAAVPPKSAAEKNPDENAHELLLLAIREAMAAGRLREELSDARLIAQTLWAGVHGVASLEITHAQDHWVDWRPLAKRIDMMVRLLIGGIVRAIR